MVRGLLKSLKLRQACRVCFKIYSILLSVFLSRPDAEDGQADIRVYKIASGSHDFQRDRSCGYLDDRGKRHGGHVCGGVERMPRGGAGSFSPLHLKIEQERQRKIGAAGRGHCAVERYIIEAGFLDHERGRSRGVSDSSADDNGILIKDQRGA